MQELALFIADDPDADEQELAELAGQLRRELLDLDVEAVDPAGTGRAPPGTKGFEVLAVGGLIVRIASSMGVLTSVVRTVQSWLSGQRGRRVRIEMDGDSIEVTGISSHDQRRLIDAWIARHAEQ